MQIVDSGADQALGGPIWRDIGSTDNRKPKMVHLVGPLAGRHEGTVLPVITGAAKLITADGKEYCAIVHEMLHDRNPHQHESLLPTAQVRDAGHAIDECPTSKKKPRCEFGTQCCVVKGIKLPLFFDGLKCYFRLEALTNEDLRSLPRVVLTSPGDYEPKKRTHTCQMNNDEVNWKRTLAFPPDNVLKATLEVTTQLIPTVEAESREIMRDHLKSRLSCLRHRRQRDMDYLDTFKANVKSVRGYNYFNLYCGQWSGYDHPVLMRSKSESPETLDAHFQHCGVPHTLKSDNAKEFKSYI